MFFKMYIRAYYIGIVFFGFYGLLIGHLIFKSTFLTRFLGVLMILGGLSWLTFLSPPLAKLLLPYNLAPGILGKGSLTLWLLLFGVNAQKWIQQSSVRQERPDTLP